MRQGAVPRARESYEYGLPRFVVACPGGVLWEFAVRSLFDVVGTIRLLWFVLPAVVVVLVVVV